MTKIGIIRCQELALGGERRCAGWNCFPAIRNKLKYLDEYETIELVGFDTCGGCPGRNRYDKIIERGLKLKEKGAEVIHVSTCIALFCPNKDKFVEVLKEKTGLPVKEKTHTRPEGEEEGPAPAAARVVSSPAKPARAVKKAAGTVKKSVKKAPASKKPGAVKKKK